MALTEKQGGIQDRISEIRKMRLGDIADNSHNWRLHPERQRKALNEVYKKVGWAGMPLVYFSEREGKLTFIDGHLRKEETPDLTVRVAVTDLNDTEADILLSTYDPLGRLAEVDVDALAELEKSVGEVKLEDFWPVGELETLLKGLNGDKEVEETEPQIDKAEQLQKEYETALGQVWTLGQHRLAIGDCTDKSVVEAVMGNDKAEILFTSPPYSNQREYKGRSNLSISYLAQIFKEFRDKTSYFVVNLGLKYYENEVDCYWDEWIRQAKEQKLKLLSWNVWDKINANSVRSQMCMFALQHEWVFVFGDDIKTLNRTWEKSPKSKRKEKYFRVNEKGQKVTTRRQADGTVSESTIGNIYENKQLGTVFTYYVEKSRSITSHPAMYPIELPLVHIEAMTEKEAFICDPFLGSGTTMMACENLNRKCRGIEIDLGYAAVSINRWEQHTGQKAELIKG